MTKKKNDDEILKQARVLINHIMLIKRKCKEHNLWLQAGHDPYKPLTDEEQQGPLVTKLFDLTANLRQRINKR